MEKLRATQLLRDDHKRITGLFRQIESVDLRAPDMKRGVRDQIFMELEVHGRIEEELFYPQLLNSATSEDIKGRVTTAMNDHIDISTLIAELRKVDIDDEQFILKFSDLIETVEPHLTLEEADLFHEAERLLGDRLEELGIQMQLRRQALIEQPRFEGARAFEVQNPRGGEQKRRTA
jgi:iron-sulfur cluster repair protein YtfE (RIC family)